MKSLSVNMDYLFRFDSHTRNLTYAMRRLPPVFERQPRVVGVVFLSWPHIPHIKPRRVKVRISTTIQHSTTHPIHLKSVCERERNPN